MEVKSHHFILDYLIYNFAFCRKFGKMSLIHIFGRVRLDYYDITLGGSPRFITILDDGGGGRNIWTAPYVS